jgi:hypothetical protein
MAKELPPIPINNGGDDPDPTISRRPIGFNALLAQHGIEQTASPLKPQTRDQMLPNTFSEVLERLTNATYAPQIYSFLRKAMDQSPNLGMQPITEASLRVLEESDKDITPETRAQIQLLKYIAEIAA